MKKPNKIRKIYYTDKGASVGTPKPPAKIVEYYYMTDSAVSAKDLMGCIHCVPEEKLDVWPDLNLAEVVLDRDSLIFQDASDVFVDPLDQAFIQEHGFVTLFQISFDASDTAAVRDVMAEIMTAKGGIVCSDTEDFTPLYDKESIKTL